MKLITCVCISIVMAIVLTAALVSAAEEYRIGPGDLIEISVWKNADLTRQRRVLPDGTMQLPLIGRISAAGKSVTVLKEEIADSLKRFIPDPELSVSVLQTGSMVIYVIGKVNHPGRFEISQDVDVLQALSMAGGLNPFAKEKEIGIFRKKDGKTDIFNFNYKEVSEGERLEQNVMLRRGDVIVVR